MIRPLPHISGYFWIHNFFFPDTASVHPYPVNAVCESATFWIRSPEWKFLKALWIRKRLDVKSGYFLSGDVTRASPVRYCEYSTSFPGSLKAEQDENFARFTTHALLPTFPEVLEWIWIRVDGQIRFEYGYVWMWTFLNLERKSCGF